ncbi:MAG: response regulator transcription factor [Victivallaceae bacterium]|nr:response regulator transcription factor [Victivallaceae bacterium]
MKNMMNKITVMLTEDHAIVREGIRALLEVEGSFEVVGEAANGLQAIEMAQRLHPSVIVLDIAMPQLNGLETARRILQQVAPPPRILILSAHSADAYVKQVISLGVSGYLIKQSSANSLVRAIKEVHKGKVFYSPSIAKHWKSQQSKLPYRTGRFLPRVVNMTSREREVLQRVAEGEPNKKIAAELFISIKTVEKHRQSLMNKLNIHDTAGLTRYAISAGIIENSVQCTIV